MSLASVESSTRCVLCQEAYRDDDTMRKALFVTGAASGIGKATALLFARKGWFVGGTDVDEAGLEKLLVELGPGQGWVKKADVTQFEELKTALAAFTSETEGRLDVMFNNAGFMVTGQFDQIPLEKASKMVAINILGVIHGTYAALPWLERTEGSLLLSMGSASGIYGIPDHAVYSASKFFVRGFNEALDIELRRKKIRVADIMPSYVNTPMVSSQSYRPATMETFGIKLTAEGIAELAWKAAQDRSSRKLHWIPQADVRALSRFGGLVPELGRVVMRRVFKV